MKTIQPIFIKKIMEYIDNLIFEAKIKINGKYKRYDIFKTIIKDNTITKYLYLEDETGVVEEAQLLTDQGEILVDKEYEIKKDLDGLVLTFRYELNVEEIEMGMVGE